MAIVALILIAIFAAIPSLTTPQAAYLLVGFGNENIRVLNPTTLNETTLTVLSTLPTTFRYAFASDSSNLYIGITQSTAVLYAVNFATGSTESSQLVSSGALMAFEHISNTLYVAIMDYSQSAPVIVKVDLSQFRSTKTLALKPYVSGTPYDFASVGNTLYLVVYDPSSGQSSLVQLTIPNLENIQVTTIPIQAATKIVAFNNKLYVRGSDKVVVYKTDPLVFEAEITSVYGYGELITVGNKIYVAGTTISGNPAVHILSTDTDKIEKTIPFSTVLGSAQNLAVEGSTVYVSSVSSTEGCHIYVINGDQISSQLVANTANAWPTAMFLVAGEIRWG